MSQIIRNTAHSLSTLLSDKLYLQLKYYKHFRRWIHFNTPSTFNEKLQWLKIHDRRPVYTTMVDKLAVRQYIAEKIGGEYLIPLLGTWDSFDQIDFSSLPDQFVLKCTHDSGSVVICKDRRNLNLKDAERKITSSLKRNFYYVCREWPYKNVKPGIIAEKYMIDSSTGELRDYKFFCFNGRADSVMVCCDRADGDTKFYFFDKNWKLLRYNKRGKKAPEDFTLPKPSNMDEMFDLAEKLSRDLPFARIDLYSVEGKTYFGEITLYPDGGFDSNLLPETDRNFGRMIDISKI